MTVEIRENEWSEDNLPILGTPFNDSAIWAQFIRQYQSAFRCAYDGVDSDQNFELFNLGDTPYPDAEDFAPLREGMTWTRAQLDCIVYLHTGLSALLAAQPYEVDGKEWYWGEPGTESAPTHIVPPAAFAEVMSPYEVGVYAFGSGTPPSKVKYREDWYSALVAIRAMLYKMQFVYSDTPVALTIKAESFFSLGTGIPVGPYGYVSTAVENVDFALSAAVAPHYKYLYNTMLIPLTPVSAWTEITEDVRMPNAGEIKVTATFGAYEPSSGLTYNADPDLTRHFMTGETVSARTRRGAFSANYRLGASAQPQHLHYLMLQSPPNIGWGTPPAYPKFCSRGALHHYSGRFPFYEATGLTLLTYYRDGVDFVFGAFPNASDIQYSAEKIRLTPQGTIPAGKKVVFRVGGTEVGSLTAASDPKYVDYITPAPTTPSPGHALTSYYRHVDESCAYVGWNRIDEDGCGRAGVFLSHTRSTDSAVALSGMPYGIHFSDIEFPSNQANHVPFYRHRGDADMPPQTDYYEITATLEDI